MGTANANTNWTPSGFTAQYTPAMMDAFRTQLGYADASNPLGGVPGSSAAAAGGLNASGMNATNAGLYGLAGFTPSGGVESNIDAATKYANNPAIGGMVSAAMRDANQNYTDIQRPGMDRNAVAGGNTNSSTRGIAEGIVERGLTQKAGDISANLRGGLFTQGLGLEQQRGLANNESTIRALMGAAQGGTGAVNAGTYAGTGAVGQQSGLFNIANAGAQNLNSGNQADLTNQLQKWNFGASAPFTPLNNFYNIVGNKSWGSQGTADQTATSTPSMMSQISGGIGMFGSLFSDARVKFDSRPIGTLNDGQIVYRFRYLDDPNTVHMGLMAQEVEKRCPEAVSEYRGVKLVNYGIATANA